MNYNVMLRKAVLVFLAFTIGLITASPAFASGSTNIHEYHFNAAWPVWGANRLEISGKAYHKAKYLDGYGDPYQPAIVDVNDPKGAWYHESYTSNSPYRGAIWAGPRTYFGSAWVLFNIKYSVGYTKGYHKTYARNRYGYQSSTGLTWAPWTPLGWKTSSAPQLYNSETVSGESGEVTNTANMVVYNLQFAQSPEAISNASTTLDNPDVMALFADSPDSVRAGPIVVAPGEESSISPPMDRRILDPTVGGPTILAKGEVEDASGTPQEFLMQFIAEESSPSTGINTIWEIVFGLFAIAAGLLIVLVQKMSGPLRTNKEGIS